MTTMINKNLVALLIVSILLMVSCASYKYDIKNNAVIAKKGNAITNVYIENQDLETLAVFVSLPNTKSKIFSLNDFSPDFFKCTDGCSFSFESGKIYYIELSPKGDIIQPPIKVRYVNGKIVKIK